MAALSVVAVAGRAAAQQLLDRAYAAALGRARAPPAVTTRRRRWPRHHPGPGAA